MPILSIESWEHLFTRATCYELNLYVFSECLHHRFTARSQRALICAFVRPVDFSDARRHGVWNWNQNQKIQHQSFIWFRTNPRSFKKVKTDWGRVLPTSTQPNGLMNFKIIFSTSDHSGNYHYLFCIIYALDSPDSPIILKKRKI